MPSSPDILGLNPYGGHDAPHHHPMLCVKGPPLGFDGIPMVPLKFNILSQVGESFWVPYYHKDVGPSWNLVFEALPGGPMDRFEGATRGEQVLEIARQFFREPLPWHADWLRDAELSDPLKWLVGKFAPTVRKPVGRLPSGRQAVAGGAMRVAWEGFRQLGGLEPRHPLVPGFKVAA